MLLTSLEDPLEKLDELLVGVDDARLDEELLLDELEDGRDERGELRCDDPQLEKLFEDDSELPDELHPELL